MEGAYPRVLVKEAYVSCLGSTENYLFSKT